MWLDAVSDTVHVEQQDAISATIAKGSFLSPMWRRHVQENQRN